MNIEVYLKKKLCTCRAEFRTVYIVKAPCVPVHSLVLNVHLKKVRKTGEEENGVKVINTL